MIEAPQITVPLLAGAGIAVWWLRGRFDRGVREGLQEQVKAHQAHRQLAEARAADISQKLEAVTSQMAALETKIRAHEPLPGLLQSATSTSSAIGELQIANNSLKEVLKGDPSQIVFSTIARSS